MKSLGPVAATAAPAGKRRWRCVAATGAALALVFFSVVVPFAVLLGLHTRFPSMYLVDESAVSVYDGSEGGTWQQVPSEENDSSQINNTVKEFVPPTSKNLTLLQNGGSVRQETSLLPLAPGEDELAIDKDERENTNRRWGSSENTKCQRSRQ